MKLRSSVGEGYLDNGDTPAFPGVYDRGAVVAGTALEGLERIMAGDAVRSFQPIGGLHHARRGCSAGFCVFNDLGVVIDSLRTRFGIKRVGYVDIDVHHGDGIYYPYEADPELIVVDIHEDGRFLYPGTGHARETGKGDATGTKLNLPLPPGAGDEAFFAAWEAGMAHSATFQTAIPDPAGRRRRPRRRSPRRPAPHAGRARARRARSAQARRGALRRPSHGVRRRGLRATECRHGVDRGARRAGVSLQGRPEGEPRAQSWREGSPTSR